MESNFKNFIININSNRIFNFVAIDYLLSNLRMQFITLRLSENMIPLISFDTDIISNCLFKILVLHQMTLDN